MEYLELTLPTPAENLALDEALLLEAEAGRGGELLRIWEFPCPAVVLGSSSILREDVLVEPCDADGVPILRRCSGGGTVLLGSGCLVYSFILSYGRAAALGDVTHSYAYTLQRVAQALEVERAGSSDLAVDGMKVSGNSQRRLRNYLLHHGTAFYEFDLASVGRYLRQPRRQPVYRADRAHRDFLVNLRLPRAALIRRLREVWEANAVVTEWPRAAVQELAEKKYLTPEWTLRR
jgi:lipoate---protein ligase